jgi:hypothetical protein
MTHTYNHLYKYITFHSSWEVVKAETVCVRIVTSKANVFVKLGLLEETKNKKRHEAVKRERVAFVYYSRYTLQNLLIWLKKTCYFIMI